MGNLCVVTRDSALCFQSRRHKKFQKHSAFKAFVISSHHDHITIPTVVSRTKLVGTIRRRHLTPRTQRPRFDANITMFSRALATAPRAAGRIASSAIRPHIQSQARIAPSATAAQALGKREYHEKDEYLDGPSAEPVSQSAPCNAD